MQQVSIDPVPHNFIDSTPIGAVRGHWAPISPTRGAAMVYRGDAPEPRSRCPSAGSAVRRVGPWGRSSERPAERADPSAAAAQGPAPAQGRRCMQARSRHWPGRSAAAAAAGDSWGPAAAAAAGAAAAGAAREAAVTAAHSAAVAAVAAVGAVREARGAVVHSVAAVVAVADARLVAAAAAAAGEPAKGGWAPATAETCQVCAVAKCDSQEAKSLSTFPAARYLSSTLLGHGQIYHNFHTTDDTISQP